MAFLFSILFFLLLLWLSTLLLILEGSCYFLLLPYALFLLVLFPFYRKATCCPLQARDFLAAALFVLCAAFLMKQLGTGLTKEQLSYLYMASFLSSLLYIDSLRFKSLM